MWWWRGKEKNSWANHVTNEVLPRVKERNILQTIKKGMLNGLVTFCVGTAF
jgi:hypothetical protein